MGHGRALSSGIAALTIAAVACSRAPVKAPEARPADPSWRFDVSAGARGSDLVVEASFPPGTPPNLEVDGSGTYLSDVRIATSGGWRDLAVANAAVSAPECLPHGCRLRYRFRLADAARGEHDLDTALAIGDAIEAPPSTWLLHPGDTTPRSYRVHVDPSVSFLSPIPPAPDGAPQTYEARGADLDVAPFAAFGNAWRVRTAVVGDAMLTIGIAPAPRALDDDGVVAWLTHAAEGIAAYYGSLPSKSPLILVLPDEGATSTDGKTLGNGGASVVFRVGPGVTPAIARESWVATHEMIHLDFPSFGFPHSWLEEGIATYVEPIIRARGGVITADRVWHDLIVQGPDGLPKAGDEGLERSGAWGRTYWGGALFCLLADVEIRSRTHNARSFDDVMRAVVATGATVAVRWDVARFLDVGDAATGGGELHELYEKYALAPGVIDLPSLWRRLGISARGDAVTYDDAAPLADVRRAITTPRSPRRTVQ